MTPEDREKAYQLALAKHKPEKSRFPTVAFAQGEQPKPKGKR